MKRIIVLTALVFSHVFSFGQIEKTDFIKQNIVNNLNKHNNFKTLAVLYSVDKDTYRNGGYIGWCTLQKFSTEVKQKLKKTQTGTYTDWIETPEHWYIFQVHKKRLFFYKLSMIMLSKTPHR